MLITQYCRVEKDTVGQYKFSYFVLYGEVVFFLEDLNVYRDSNFWDLEQCPL